MKRIDEIQSAVASFSCSSSSLSSTWFDRSNGVLEYWSDDIRSIQRSEFEQRIEVVSRRGVAAGTTVGRTEDRFYRVFCGLGLELFARPVITNETVLPKAAVTAGKVILRVNLSVASAAPRDARQRNLWKGEW
jgi:hypothetical protein